MYPKTSFPLSVIREKFKSIIINPGDYNSDTVDMDHLISIIAGESINNQPPLMNGWFHALGTPEQHHFIPNSTAYTQTKQPNPDYLKITWNNSIDKKIVWARYYDFKTGKISVNKGHIYITSDASMYETNSQALLHNQFKMYKNLLPQDSPIMLYLYYLVNENTKNWGDRNDLFKKFLLNQKNIPDNINPSLIFKVTLDYNTENLKPSKKLEGYVTRASFENFDESTKTLAEVIYHVGGVEAVNIYTHFNPFSSITTLIKTFIE